MAFSYMVAVVSMIKLICVAESKCTVDAKLIRLSKHCISYYFHFNKQLYISNKMEHFSYNGGCGMHEDT